MTDFAEQVLSNGLADLLLAILLAGIAIGVSNASWRRHVHDFFGVRRPGAGAIRVRLSSISVRPGGSIGTETVVEGFFGPAISELEYRYALGLAQSIQLKPIAKVIRALMESAPGSEEPVVCDITMTEPYTGPMPADFAWDRDLTDRLRAKLRGATYVLVGEPLYNVMTRYVLSAAPSRFRFLGGTPGDEGRRRSIRVQNIYHSRNSHEEDSHESEDYERQQLDNGECVEYAILERITNWNGITIFICAGTSTAATVAALRHLTEWRALARRFDRALYRRQARDGSGDPAIGNFGILYQVRTTDVENVPDPDRVLERWVYPPPSTWSAR